MDEYLDGLSKLVHEALKRLKMDETGSVTCSKQYPPDEVRLDVQAYGLHKRKWFETEHDKASNVIRCKRAKPPPWPTPDAVDEEEVE